MTLSTLTKQRKCKICKTKFTPRQPMATVCSLNCAQSLAVSIRGKAEKVARVKEKQADKAKLEAMRTKPQLTAIAQTAFNAYIRTRDFGKPCISCGKPYDSRPNMWDAGHYRSVGSAPHMRFVEDNCHGQCKRCNRYLSGNHADYRVFLSLRIGPRTLELLEADQCLRKYTREGLQEIARYYSEETRKLKAAQA